MLKTIRIQVKLDIRKDAWNWWDACNKISYGVDWKERIDGNLRKKIHGKTKQEAMRFLLPYLRDYYKRNDKDLKRALYEANKLFRKKANSACKLMEKITQYPVYRNNFTCFLTTFPRCPYDYKKGYIWLAAPRPAKIYLNIFLHELLHFQYYAYYKNRPSVKKLSMGQSEFLKEALTVILNHEFSQYLYQKDKGYKLHQKLRKELENFWKKNKDFSRLIDYGAAILTKKNHRDNV